MVEGTGIRREEDGTLGAAVIARPEANRRRLFLFLIAIASKADSLAPAPTMGLVLGPGRAAGPRVDGRPTAVVANVKVTGGEADTAWW